MMEQGAVSPKRYEYIDALRGVAALSVALYHGFLFSGKQNLSRMYQDIIEQGARGVQLFYVLSAFTLFLSLQAHSEKEGIAVKAFFIRRIFRIAPLFYAAVIFYLWLYGIGPRWTLGDQSHVTLGNIIANVLFINSASPYWINSVVPVGWSVAVEMAFYCITPLLFLKIRNGFQALIFFIISYVCAVAVNGYLVSHPFISNVRLWREYLFYWLPNQLPVFALGILLFFVMRDFNPEMWTNKKTAKMAGALLLTISMCLMYLLTKSGYFHISTHFLYGMSFALLTLALAIYPIKIFVNRFFCYAGKISYSIYLTHIACLRAARLMTPMIWGPNAHWRTTLTTTIIIEISLAMMVSTITYKLIEIPGQNIGKMIIRKYKM